MDGNKTQMKGRRGADKRLHAMLRPVRNLKAALYFVMSAITARALESTSRSLMETMSAVGSMGLPALAGADFGGAEATEGMTWLRGVALGPDWASRLCKFKGSDMVTVGQQCSSQRCLMDSKKKTSQRNGSRGGATQMRAAAAARQQYSHASSRITAKRCRVMATCQKEEYSA